MTSQLGWPTRPSPRPTPFRDEFRQQFPDVQLEDELFEKVGRNVMVGLQ
jgi:hypothetical protein